MAHDVPYDVSVTLRMLCVHVFVCICVCVCVRLCVHACALLSSPVYYILAIMPLRFSLMIPDTHKGPPTEIPPIHFLAATPKPNLLANPKTRLHVQKHTCEFKQKSLHANFLLEISQQLHPTHTHPQASRYKKSNSTLLIHPQASRHKKSNSTLLIHTLKHPDTNKATAPYSYTPSSIQTQTKQQHFTHTHPQASRHKKSNSTLLIHPQASRHKKSNSTTLIHTLKHPDKIKGLCTGLPCKSLASKAQTERDSALEVCSKKGITF